MEMSQNCQKQDGNTSGGGLAQGADKVLSNALVRFLSVVKPYHTIVEVADAGKMTTQTSPVFHARTTAAGAALVFLLAAGCSQRSGQVAPAIHQMGERVRVGPLVYNVLEVEWLSQLDSEQPQTSDHRFAVISLTISNAGNREVRLPMLHVEDEKGQAAMELVEVHGVEEWLGILRSIRPAETIQGKIVFGLKPQNYRLRVTDGDEPHREKTAMVAIPLRFNSPVPVKADQPGTDPVALPEER
jgi:hypothetical protein